MSRLPSTRSASWPCAWLLAGVVMACQLPASTPIVTPTSPAPARANSGETSDALAVVPTLAPQASERRRKPAGKRAGPPKIKLARVIGPRTIELVFTEAMGPTDQLDPNAFRLSVGMDYRYPRYAYANYYDAPGAFSDAQSNFVAAHRVADDVMQLELEAELDEQMCPELVEMRKEIKLEPGVRGTVGLFLHYAPPAKGAVVDSEGDALAGFGEAFAGDRKLEEREFEGKAARKVLATLRRVECKWP